MAQSSIAQTNFNAGELGPRMAGRPDLAAYQNGVAELCNFVPLVQGPITKRPGTIHVNNAANNDQPSRLIAWTPRLTQAYVVEASPGKLRFFTNNALLQSAGSPVEVATPWDGPAVARLNWQTSSDVIYMVDGARPMHRLSRISATSFVLAMPELRNGPFKDMNIEDGVTVQASAVLGTVILSASHNIFQPGHVGALFMLEALDFSSVPAWEPGITVNLGEDRRSDGKIYEALDTGRTGSVQPIHTRGAEYDGMASGTDINSTAAGGVRWQYKSGRFGTLRITRYISPTQVEATVLTRLPQQVATSPTWRWAHGAFSDVEGWPTSVAIWQERLWLARGNRIWGSVVGDLLNHAAQTDAGLVTADLAIAIALPAADDIVWMEGDRALLVGTARAEYAIGGVSSQAAVSASNIAAQRQSRYGSAAVRPEPAGTRVLFVQRGSRKVRQTAYSFQDDRYVAPDLTVRAHHIGRPGIVAMAMQDEPEALLWCLRSDGRLACLTFSEDEDVRGWSRQLLAGTGARVESICCVPAPDGGSDQLWMAVVRTIGGTPRRYIERLAPFREETAALAEALHLDASLTYRGAPAATFSGLAHLAGESVMALVDGAAVGPMTVTAGGTLTLPPGLAGSVVHIGLPFTARVRTMRMEAPASDGVGLGRIKKITRLIVRMLDAIGITMAGSTGNKDAVLLRPDGLAPEAALPAFTGDVSAPFPGGHSRDGIVVLESTDPLPATILALFPTIDVGST